METLSVGMINQLQTLAEGNHQLAQDELDIRGWEVTNADGDYIGDVQELLFDVAHQKVRYLIVDLNNNELGLDEHLILVPVGLAEVREEADEVVLPSVKTSQLQMLHPYQAADFDSSEKSVQAAYIGTDLHADEDGSSPVNFYEHEHFNDQNLYKNRRKISESQEETILFPINEDLNDQVDITTDNLIEGADLDIPNDGGRMPKSGANPPGL